MNIGIPALLMPIRDVCGINICLHDHILNIDDHYPPDVAGNFSTNAAGSRDVVHD